MSEVKEDSIYDVCKQYGVICEYDSPLLDIKFKDGKILSYVVVNDGLDVKKHSFNDSFTRLPFSHGRVFKDSKFIGYTPKCNSLDEILIAVDMMVA